MARAGPGALLVATVDAWCPTPDFTRFASEASRIRGDPTVLAVTSLVDDPGVRGLVLNQEDEPGFWESYGYHNYGDPWREQRYSGD